MNRIGKVGRKAILVFALVVLIVMATGTVASAQSQGGWRGEYYNNTTLSGSPVLVRTDKAIDFDWGVGSPAAGVGADSFSVRWTGTLSVSPGRYRFSMATDDGGRLWINGQLVIDKWLDQQGDYHEFTMDLPTGSAYVQMDYYENTGGARALLAYMRLDGPPGSGGPWNAEYFNNKNLSGTAALLRTEADINFNWGQGSPASGTIGADNFSARWTRNLDLFAGRYQFVVTVDDGARLWVNNQLVIDQWRDQEVTTYRVDLDLSGGTVPVRLEYYDNTGEAKVQLSWALISAGNPPGGAPASGPWRAEYFNNTGLSGSPVLVRYEAQPNISWAYNSPAPGIVGGDAFSVRWSHSPEFISGRYRFTATTDDGMRLWVNNQLIIDNWRNQPAQAFSGEIDLAGGYFPVRMEYFDGVGLAEARLSWQRLGPAAGTGGPLPGGVPTATVTSYYLNVRQGPGIGYAIIAKLSKGQVVQLAGFRNADATWVKVILPDGRQGWSYAGFLAGSIPFSSLAVEGAPSAPAPPAGGSTATVTKAFYVNVRTGPGVGYTIITFLKNGTVVTLLGRNTTGTWAKVQLASGTVGWMNAYYLTSATPISSLPIAG